MQILIDIDENLYTRLFDCGDNEIADMDQACTAIRKGKVIPDGHGNLLDEYVLVRQLVSSNILKDEVKCQEITKIMDNSILVQFQDCSDTRYKTCSSCKHWCEDITSCNSCYEYDTWEADTGVHDE